MTGAQRDEAHADTDAGLTLLDLDASAAVPAAPPGEWSDPLDDVLDRRGTWVKRRIEQLEFLDASAVRQRVTVEFEVPLESPILQVGDKMGRLVPVTTVPKDAPPLELRDESGAAMWVPTPNEIGRRIAPAMVVRAKHVLRVDSLPHPLEHGLRKIVATPPSEHESEYLPFAVAEAAIDAEFYRQQVQDLSVRRCASRFWHIRSRCEDCRDWKRAQAGLAAAIATRQFLESKAACIDQEVRDAAYRLMSNVGFRIQMLEVARNYLVYVFVRSAPGTRRLVSLTAERGLSFAARNGRWKRIVQGLGWRCWQVDTSIGGRGGRVYLEIAAPPGVDIVRVIAQPATAADGYPTIQRRGFVPHVRVEFPYSSTPRYRARIYLRASRTGWLWAYMLVAVLIAAVTLTARMRLAGLYSAAGRPSTGAGTAGVVLGALLGVIGSWLVGQVASPLAARLLRHVRTLMALDVAAVLIGTGDLLFRSYTSRFPVTLWSGLAWVTAAIAFLITISWLLPLEMPWRSGHPR